MPSASNGLETAGGFALAFAAGALAPNLGPSGTNPWSGLTMVAHDVNLNMNSTAWPATISFSGRAIALIGTVGEFSGNGGSGSVDGHAYVLIDGVPMQDQTGIWQAKNLLGYTYSNNLLFAWQWQVSGNHTITIQPGTTPNWVNLKEGHAFIHTVAISAPWLKPGRRFPAF